VGEDSIHEVTRSRTKKSFQEIMKKRTAARETSADTEIPTTDFSKGVRGKYAAALKKNGYIIKVKRRDGTAKKNT
jgi:hypothetical protein